MTILGHFGSSGHGLGPFWASFGVLGMDLGHSGPISQKFAQELFLGVLAHFPNGGDEANLPPSAS